MSRPAKTHIIHPRFPQYPLCGTHGAFIRAEDARYATCKTCLNCFTKQWIDQVPAPAWALSRRHQIISNGGLI